MKKYILLLFSIVTVCNISAMDKSNKFVGAGRLVKDGALISLGALITYRCYRAAGGLLFGSCIATGVSVGYTVGGNKEDAVGFGVIGSICGLFATGFGLLGTGVGYLTAKRALNLLEDLKK